MSETPVIAYHNLLLDATKIIASTTCGDVATTIEDTDSPISNCYDALSYTSFKSNSTSDNYIVVYPDNEITNYNFASNTNDWTLTAGLNTVTLTRETASPLKGSGSGKITFTTASGVAPYITSNIFDLVEADTYKSSFICKLASGTSSCIAALYDASGTVIDSYSFTASGTSTWHNKTWALTDDYTDATMRITISGTGTLYIDDISVAKTYDVDTFIVTKNNSLATSDIEILYCDNAYNEGTNKGTLIASFNQNSNKAILKIATSPVKALYYIIHISNLTANLDIPEMYIGTSWQFEYNPNWGYDENNYELKTTSVEATTGYERYSIDSCYRNQVIDLPLSNSTTYAKYKACFDLAYSVGRPVYYSFQPTTKPEDLGLYRFDTKNFLAPRQVRQLRNINFTLKELL